MISMQPITSFMEKTWIIGEIKTFLYMAFARASAASVNSPKTKNMRAVGV